MGKGRESLYSLGEENERKKTDSAKMLRWGKNSVGRLQESKRETAKGQRRKQIQVKLGERTRDVLRRRRIARCRRGG